MPRNNTLLTEQLTDPAYYILLALWEPRHGYSIMQFIEQLTEGDFTIGPATLYTVLKKLQEAEYIEPTNDGDSRRKTYALTEKGRTIIANEVERRYKMALQGRQVIQVIQEKGGART